MPGRKMLLWKKERKPIDRRVVEQISQPRPRFDAARIGLPKYDPRFSRKPLLKNELASRQGCLKVRAPLQRAPISVVVFRSVVSIVIRALSS
jgi:hypothetical protein